VLSVGSNSDTVGRSLTSALVGSVSVLLVLAAGLDPALAKVYCSEPVLPFCVNRSGVFEDATAEERCKSEVEKFNDGMEEYVQCLGEQQREARERAEEIAARFECMSRGEENCR
jgi:hypothetical protein